MQKLYLLLALCLSASTALIGQDAIIGQGFANGFNNPGDIVSFGASFGGSRILTSQSNSTGDRFFRLVRGGGDNTEFGPAATCPSNDQFITGNTGNVFNGVGGCGKAFAINVPNTTDFYVFKTPDANSTTQFMFFQLEGPIATVTSTNQLPAADGAGKVASNTPVVVTSLTDVSLPSGQVAYLRYTTNGFGMSTVIPMMELPGASRGAFSSTLQATIPGQPDGTTVEYYIFTTGDAVAPLSDGVDADYRTINGDNNGGDSVSGVGGSNYSYTTDAALPVTYLNWTGTRRKAQLVSLAWATASEDQASHFSIECSTNQGRNWTPRGSLAAENNANGAAYVFTDQNAPAGDLQYRLRQTDLDGTAHFSTIISIPAWQDDVRFWPQPVGNGLLNLSAPERYVGGTAELLGVDGRRIKTFDLVQEEQSLEFDVPIKGVFILRLTDRNGKSTLEKIVVQ